MLVVHKTHVAKYLNLKITTDMHSLMYVAQAINILLQRCSTGPYTQLS